MTNTIFLVVGESGSGKDTVVNRLVSLYGLRRLDSYTTRPRRNLEDRHIFVDDYYDWTIQNPNETIVGYTEFNGYHYWATASQVEQSDLYIIDPDGVRFFLGKYNGPKNVRIMYLQVPAHIRVERMLKRGDGIFNASHRLNYDGKKFEGAKMMADHIVSNGTVEQMAEDMWRYIETSRK